MKISDLLVPKAMRIGRFGDLVKIVGVGVACFVVFEVAQLIGQGLFFALVIGAMGLAMVAMLWAIASQCRDPAVRERLKRGYDAWRRAGGEPSPPAEPPAN
jgi:hypothetical protein